MTGDPFLTLDELRILESIAADGTRAPDERLEAARRLNAQMDIGIGLSMAALDGALMRLGGTLTEVAGAMQGFEATLRAVLVDARRGLTAEELVAVDRLIVAGEAELDAIVAVVERRSGAR